MVKAGYAAVLTDRASVHTPVREICCGCLRVPRCGAMLPASWYARRTGRSLAPRRPALAFAHIRRTG